VIVLVDFNAVMHVDICGVGLGTREDYGFHPGFADIPSNGVGQSHFMQACVGDDQCLAATERFGAAPSFPGAPRADEGDAGNKETVCLVGNLLIGHVVS
jgi:hypothetical protein